MPTIQSAIDFEIGEGERTRTRILYQRLLDRTKHVKVTQGNWEEAHDHTLDRELSSTDAVLCSRCPGPGLALSVKLPR
jgi:hypothetical protein